MNTIKMTLMAVCAVALAGAFAAEEDPELGKTDARGRWTVHAGYAWRSNVKTSFRGSTSARPYGGTYENGSWNTADDKDWTTTTGFDQSRYDNPTTAGDKLNALALTRSDSACGGSDDEGMQGFKFGVGYDVYSGDTLSVAVMLDFAGYWRLENSRRGGYNRYTDYFAFNYGPSVSDGFDPVSGVNSAEYVEREYIAGTATSAMRTKLKADLYQIGFGPHVTWHAFEGWCPALSWIDIYGNVDALCNIINSDLNVGGASTSDTNCRAGVGGNIGIVGNITDNIGIYCQAGYEWIDEDDVNCYGISAKTDYSSIVFSAGLVFGF